MHQVFRALLLVACAYVAYTVLSIIFASFRKSRRARQLGCAPPIAVPQPWWDLLGITTLAKTAGMARQKILGDYFLERHELLSDLAGYDVKTASIGILGKSILYTEDPKNIQAMLATQFKDFSLGVVRRGCFFPLLGNGIFTADGKIWEHSRAMLRPSFAKERVSNLELEERHNLHLYNAIPGRSNATGWTDPVDLQTLFFRLTIDTSTEFLFGESVESQRAEMASDTPKLPNTMSEINFAAAFDDAQTTLSRRIRLGPRYWLVQPKKLYDDCAKCHAFIDHYVYKALAKYPESRPTTSSSSSDEKQNSAEKREDRDKSKYIFLHELVQQTRDPIELRSQLLNILLAGRDTTASILGWLFALLARHPDIFQRLRSSILEDFGTDATARSITFASLKNCKYLQWCLNEALRLYPVVPLNSRVSVTETTLPRGGGPDGESPIYITAHQFVGYSVYAMHRNTTLWDSDAHIFRPERWDGRKQGFEFLPFNAGPRICLGQNFALTSAGFATVALLQRFDAMELVSVEEGGERRADGSVDVEGVRGGMRQNITLTMRPDAGVNVRLHRAEVAT